MSLFNEILQYKSVSVAGMAKNAGKTECLNYILNGVKNSGKQIAVTSIGVDGESFDRTNKFPKPEIEIFEGMIFITSETHYRQKQLVAEILDINENRTALGRLVIAKALSQGKVLLSGPTDTKTLKILIDSLQKFDIDTVIIDGALSRLSPASPAIAEAMILATGAAVSGNISHLIKKTKYIYDLIELKSVDDKLQKALSVIDNGIWAIDSEGEIHDLHITSVFMPEQNKDDLLRYGNTLFVSGAVSDNLLRFLSHQKNVKEIKLIVRDFTRIFVSEDVFYAFRKKGGEVEVLDKNRLIAVSINPVSPNGYDLNGDELMASLQKILAVPVINVKR